MPQGAQAGAAYSIYRLDLTGFRQDVAQIQRELASLQSAARTATSGVSGVRAPSASAPVAGGTADAERATLRYASALAQAQKAQGDLAGAAQTYRTALSQITPNTIEAHQATTKLAQAETALQQSLRGGSSLASEFGGALKGNLLSLIGPAAAAGAAFAALRTAVQQAEEGFKLQATLDTSRRSINLLLAGVRDSGEVWAGAARFAETYKLTQQETTEAIQASVRIIRTSKAPIEDVLGAFARLKVLAPEKTFTDASRALSELQAGQVVSIEHLFNVPRRDANEMKKAIEGGADAVQVLNGYLDKTGVTMDAVRAGAEGASGKLREMAQETEKFQLALGGGSGGAGLVILDERLALLRGSTRLLSGDMEGARQSITQAAQEGSFGFQLFNTIMGGTLGRIATYQAATNQAAAATAQQAAAIQAATNAALQNTAATGENAGAMQFAAQANNANAIMAQQVAQAEIAAANSMAMAGVQARAAAQAADLKSNADQLAAVNAQTHKVAVDALNLAAQDAARALLANGNQGAASAAQLAGSSSQVDVLTAAYYRLFAAQNQAVPRSSVIGAGIEQTTKRLEAQGESYRKIRDAQEQQVLQTGTAAQKQALLNKQLDRARVTYGEQSVQFINAQTALKNYQQQQDKPKRGGGGGGAPKLSDQQKLNNSLITQQQQYQQQAEDLDIKHYQKRAQLFSDYAEKARRAEAALGQSNLDSRASFYDRLGSIDDAGLRQALSAQYEQAFAEAQQVAQEQGADVAQKFLEAKQAALEAQASRAAEIQKAQKEGDAGRAEYLKGVDELHRQAEEARVAAARSGEDSITAQRDKALQDEDRAYEEQSGKIADHAENAAQRKIDAEVRSGKQIDATNTALERQAGLYDRIATTPTTATGTTPQTTTPAAQTPAGAAQIWAVSDAAVLGAINAQTDMQAGRYDAMIGRLSAIEGAVRGLGSSGGIAG